MPVRTLYDTISGTTGHRLPAVKDRDGTTHYSFSNGVEYKTTKVAEGVKGRSREVREISGIKTPKVWDTPANHSDDYGDRFDRIFGHGKYAEGKDQTGG